jgi:predicted AAA+ superfamily ATPase
VVEAPIDRLLKPPARSFFLFGPRGTGKSTWLRRALPGAVRLDLLDASLALELGRDPHRLEALVGGKPAGSWVVLDEIQKIPALLDEVHRLMEERRWRFALCGSSARKLRRGGVNLLAGRAVTRRMGPFSARELGAVFDPSFSLSWGMLPAVHGDPKHAADILSAYVHTYLREEIREEGVLRREPPFLRFLAVAGQLNGQAVNTSNIAREAGVPRTTVEVYLSVLVDTLLGELLPAYRPGLKVRERAHPKFYWFDAGVARAAAGLLHDPIDRLWKGTSLETLVLHELKVYNETSGRHRPIAYYRTPAGVEVDFVVELRKRQGGKPPRLALIEVKLAEAWDRRWEAPLRALSAERGVRVARAIGVYQGSRAYRTAGLDVLPLGAFLDRLHDGKIF